MSERLLDRAGRRRSPATMLGFHAGHAPGNKDSNLGITSFHLQGIDSGEIIETVHGRRARVIPVSASLRL